MIKNFCEDEKFNNVFNKLGIDKRKVNRVINVNLKRYECSVIEREIINDEKYEDLDGMFYDDTTEDNSILTYKDKNVVIYMKNQTDGVDYKYKYHIAMCERLEERIEEGNIRKYVTSTRDDGKFYVNKIDKHTKRIIKENILENIDVCVNCLEKLNYENYNNEEKDRKREIRKKFSLRNYLNKVYINDLNDLDLRTYETQEADKYPKNWSEISRIYREMKKWTCEECGDDYSNNKSKLEVHHIDRRKTNVSLENLKVLCHTCHDKEHGRCKIDNIEE